MLAFWAAALLLTGCEGRQTPVGPHAGAENLIEPTLPLNRDLLHREYLHARADQVSRHCVRESEYESGSFTAHGVPSSAFPGVFSATVQIVSQAFLASAGYWSFSESLVIRSRGRTIVGSIVGGATGTGNAGCGGIGPRNGLTYMIGNMAGKARAAIAADPQHFEEMLDDLSS